MAIGSLIVNKGKNNFLKRMYGTDVTAVSQFQMGTDDTSPTVDDFRCNAPVSFLTTATMDTCDATTGWTQSADGIAPTTDTSIKIEGTASLNLGKSGTASDAMYYTKTIGAFDLSDADKRLNLWVYVADVATRAKIQELRIYVSDDGFTSYYGWIVGELTDINIGWNVIDIDVNGATPDYSNGTPDLSAVTDIRLYIQTTATSDTITLGNIKMDYWHQGKYWKDKTPVGGGNPTFDESARTSTLRCDVAPSECNGVNLVETCDANTEDVPELEGHDVFVSIPKTSKEAIILQFINEAV